MIQTLTFVQYQGRVLVQSARVRRLGNLYVPSRLAYTTIMPLILLACGLLCLATATDLILVVSSCILTAVSLYLAFDLLGRRAPLRISTLLAMTLGLAYGLGTANTWFTLPRGDLSLADFLHQDATSLCLAMASIVWAIALLLLVGEIYEPPFFGEEFELEFNSRALVFITLGTLICLAGYATGKVGFMGATLTDVGSEAGHVSVVASAVVWLTGSLLAFTITAALNARSRAFRIYCSLLSALLFLMVLPLGRRQQIYTMVLCLVALRLGRYRVPLSPIQKTIATALLAGFLYLTTVGFFYLRLAGFTLSHPTLSQRVSAAIALAKTKSYAEVKKQFSSNVESRTFVIGFLSSIEGYSLSMPTAHGVDLEMQAEAAIPSVLDPGKDRFYREEAEVNRRFGSHYVDEANSIFTAGALDFGFMGVLVYPLLVVFTLRWFFEALTRSMPPMAACFVILASCSTLLEPETDATAYFVVMRDALVFGSFAWMIMSAPEVRLRGGNW